MKKEKSPLPPLLNFRGHLVPMAISSLVGFASGGASIYMAIEDQHPPLIQTKQHITFQTCFTPRHQCQPLLISAIENASDSIHMQNYSFTAQSVADALIRAHNRGVDVQVISDKGQFHNRSVVMQLVNAGIPVYVDEKVAIAHNKILIIDQAKVVTGSYNFSTVAENRNAENLLIVESIDLAKQYLENWEIRCQASVPFRGGAAH